MGKNIYGIWIGTDSSVAVTESLTIAFLRLEKDLIVSILHHRDMGVIGVTYGHGVRNAHDHTSAIIRNNENEFVKNNEEASDFINLHSSDKISYNEQSEKLIYTTYDNRVFENILAEKIEMSDFDRNNEIDNSLSAAEKMAQWGRGMHLTTDMRRISAGISTRRYSMCYDIDWSGVMVMEGKPMDEFIYCRVGQNGYCEKGWAMLPGICIRHHQTYSIFEDNSKSIEEYKPNEDWFIDDGCSFPQDGGWYWALKEMNDDVIYLQGCGGQVYQIHRK